MHKTVNVLEEGFAKPIPDNSVKDPVLIEISAKKINEARYMVIL